jgi:ABC-type sugar transport system substrate-binding protein
MKPVVFLAVTFALLLATPALAKTKSKGGKVTGVYCAQGPDNAYFPASSFAANIRAKMYKGQKVKFNYPGYGPINCVVY